MKYPFEAPLEELQADLDTYVEVVFSCLESEFMVIPKGRGFIEYQVFARAYEALKQATNGFISLHPDVILETVKEVPLALIVLRTIMGFTPPEWAYITSQRTGIEISMLETACHDMKKLLLRKFYQSGRILSPRVEYVNPSKLQGSVGGWQDEVFYFGSVFCCSDHYWFL